MCGPLKTFNLNFHFMLIAMIRYKKYLLTYLLTYLCQKGALKMTSLNRRPGNIAIGYC